MNHHLEPNDVQHLETGHTLVCLSCGRLLASPDDGIRADDGRCLCAACYRHALLPGHRGMNTESMD